MARPNFAPYRYLVCVSVIGITSFLMVRWRASDPEIVKPLLQQPPAKAVYRNLERPDPDAPAPDLTEELRKRLYFEYQDAMNQALAKADASLKVNTQGFKNDGDIEQFERVREKHAELTRQERAKLLDQLKRANNVSDDELARIILEGDRMKWPRPHPRWQGHQQQ